MPLAVLVYDLPEEQEEFEQAQRAWRADAALDTFRNKLREKLKYGDITDAERELYEQVREWFAEACDQYSVDT